MRDLLMHAPASRQSAPSEPVAARVPARAAAVGAAGAANPRLPPYDATLFATLTPHEAVQTLQYHQDR